MWATIVRSICCFAVLYALSSMIMNGAKESQYDVAKEFFAAVEDGADRETVDSIINRMTSTTRERMKEMCIEIYKSTKDLRWKSVHDFVLCEA